MNPMMKSIAALAVTTVSMLNAGCDSSSHVEKLADAGTAAIAPGSLEITGSVTKGALINADCVVWYRGEQWYSTVGRAAACTNSLGRFRFYVPPLPPFEPFPLLFSVVPRIDTRMLCDYPGGCSSALFGTQAVIPDALEMRSMIPPVTTPSVSTHISAWTDAATARATTLAGGNIANVTSANLATANGEVAGVLNNIFGLEGQPSAFGTNFSTIDPGNLTAPAGTDSRLGSLISIASASIVGLTDSSTNLAQAIAKISSAFAGDGKLNVNATAANIVAGDGVNLAGLLGNVRNVITGLPGVLSTTQLAGLQTALGNPTALQTLGTQVTELRDAKLAVTDANNDPTAPQPVVPVANPLVDAKRFVAKVATAFDALDGTGNENLLLDGTAVAVKSTGGATGAAFEALLKVSAAANLLALAPDAALSGCATVNNSQRICALANLIENDAINGVRSSGSLSFNKSTRVITGSVTFDGVNVNLSMTAPATLPNAAAAFPAVSFTLANTTAIAANGAVTLAVVNGTTTLASSTGFDAASTVAQQTLTINDAQGSEELGVDGVAFNGTVTLQREIRESAAQTGNALTNATLSGAFSRSGFTDVVLKLGFVIDADSVFDAEAGGESAEIPSLSIVLTAPTSFRGYNLSTLVRDSAYTDSILTTTLQGSRESLASGVVTLFKLVLTAPDIVVAGVGTYDFDDNTDGNGSLAFTDQSVTLTLTAHNAEDGNTFGGNVTVSGAQQATISSNGTVSFTDNTALSLPGAVLGRPQPAP